MREAYWLEAKASTTKIIEYITPKTVIIEPAIVDIIARAPSAPNPNRLGHWVIQAVRFGKMICCNQHKSQSNAAHDY
jgi:hypothetical protein